MAGWGGGHSPKDLDSKFKEPWTQVQEGQAEGSSSWFKMPMQTQFIKASITLIREDIKTKKLFNSGIARKGGVYPCPNFLDTFF